MNFFLLWCVQEVAGLKEEDLLSEIHSPTAGAGGGDPSSILSESQYTHVHKLFNVTVVLLYTGIVDPKSDVQTDIVEQKEEDHIHSPIAGSGSGDPSSILSESQYTHVHKLFNVTVVLLYTGIADLAQVKRFLKNMSDWFTLGLELGLLFHTLKKIDEEKHGDIERRKTEMLAAWLQQQDNVSQIGAPSWSVLRQALGNIGENELAKSKINTS